MNSVYLIIITIIATILFIIGVYAFFALFKTLGFAWSFIVIFFLLLFFIKTLPDAIITSQLFLPEFWE